MRGYYETEKARATQPDENVTPLKELAHEWRNLADLPPTDDETSRVLRLCADDLDASMRAAGIKALKEALKPIVPTGPAGKGDKVKFKATHVRTAKNCGIKNAEGIFTIKSIEKSTDSERDLLWLKGVAGPWYRCRFDRVPLTAREADILRRAKEFFCEHGRQCNAGPSPIVTDAQAAKLAKKLAPKKRSGK